MFKIDGESLIKDNYYFHDVARNDIQETALEVAKLGYSVVVLEAKTIGFGASGRNGGEALGGYSCSMSYFEKHCGRENAQEAWNIAMLLIVTGKMVIWLLQLQDAMPII